MGFAPGQIAAILLNKKCQKSKKRTKKKDTKTKDTKKKTKNKKTCTSIGKSPKPTKVKGSD
jgi:hypothetical protein